MVAEAASCARINRATPSRRTSGPRLRLNLAREGKIPLRVACTLDIFAHPEVKRSLGKDGLADAVFNALYRGRMCVFPAHLQWVLELIGSERAALCLSLPDAVRSGRAVGEKLPSK
jgi:hypothetical protein